MNKKVIIIIVVLLAIVLCYYFWKKSKAKKDLNPTTAGRKTPDSSWTEKEWLLNGYTQNEIDTAKKLQSNIPTFSLF